MKGIEAIYLLNSSIDELYDDHFIGTRVRNALKKLEVKNFADLRDRILKSVENKKRGELDIIALRSMQEINNLFELAGIKMPEYW